MTSDRRGFLKQASMAAAGTAALSAASYAQVGGANDRFQVAIIGPGGMGTGHLRTLVGQKDVQITHVCDVDQARLAAAVKGATVGAHAPRGESDMRRVLDQKNVVAVFIATPDHWHAPATLLSLAAGKHVYVEK